MEKRGDSVVKEIIIAKNWGKSWDPQTFDRGAGLRYS
jgi:hypothetical protein